MSIGYAIIGCTYPDQFSNSHSMADAMNVVSWEIEKPHMRHTKRAWLSN